MTRYVAWLERSTTSLGIPIETRCIPSWDDAFACGASTIINCTGLGARELARDAAMTPMRGQIIHVRNSLGLDFSLHDEPKGDVVTYVFAFPRHLVLGGTYEPGISVDETEPDAVDAILERCRNLLRADGHPRWNELGRDEIKRVAGLRPARVVGNNSEAIRLELERLGGGRAIVHNYGHGRSGVTLSWGCAADVVRCVDDARRPH
jgi:D-amino-acid oxidase